MNTPHSFLIWGGDGWIAGHLYALLKTQGKQVMTTTVRMEDRETVKAELARIRPTHVLNCAGCTGRPNVDWCEENREATVRSNVIGTLNLADCCFLDGIHCTVLATGCIYEYDSAHPSSSGIGYVETDPGNFIGSFYSVTKAATERILLTYPNTLVLRLRMPVSDDLHPRSFVTKITSYARVVDVPNSHSVLHSLLPCAVLLSEARDVGVYNFTNPGAIGHNEVLALFRDRVRPGFRWENFSLDEQAKVIKAGRSNCELDVGKLVARMRDGFGIEVPDVRAAYRDCFDRMAREMKREEEEDGMTGGGKEKERVGRPTAVAAANRGGAIGREALCEVPNA